MISTDFNLSAFKKDVLEKSLARFKSPALTLSEYIRQAWPILEPANPLASGWHIDLLSEYLTLVSEGKILRLLINMPPRNAKSNVGTILFPTWVWTRKPSMRFVFCSYSASLSVKHSVDRRRVIESKWYQDNWGGVVRLSADQNQKNEYENNARGHMIATSVGGTITGKGGDINIEDDMLNPKDADSEAERRKSLIMHKDVLSTRLNDPKTGARILIEQRTHDKDVSGYVIKEEGGWVRVSLPLVAERKTIIDFPVSKKRIVREPGDLLNPQRQGKRECDDLKKAMGSRSYNAQCQQNPTSEAGNILKRHWWKFWYQDVKGFDLDFMSWDMTFKETKSGSYVVGQFWKRRKARKYLVDQIRGRWDFPEAVAAFKNFCAKHPSVNAKLVEDKANGPAIISHLQSEISGIIPVTPLGSKAARAQAAAVEAEAGNIFLPDPTQFHWVADLIEECAAFKGASGEINDQVDALTQAVNWTQQLDIYPENIEDDGIDSFLEQGELATVGGFSSV